MLKGNAQSIVNKIPQIVSECSSAYINMPNIVVMIRMLLFSKEIKLFLKKVSSAIGGSNIVDIAKIINVSHESRLNPIIPVFQFGNIFSKALVKANTQINPTDVNATFFQNLLPLFKLCIHSLNEKSFLHQKYIDAELIPKYAVCDTGVYWFKERGEWVEGTEEPRPGMIIFFDWEYDGLDGNSDHTGIVEKVEGGRVYTIEGNASDSCMECSYPIGYYEILGYGAPAY